MCFFFVGNVSSSLCFPGFDVSVRPALTDSRRINQTGSVLCHTLPHSFYGPGRSHIPSFGLINSCFLVTPLCVCRFPFQCGHHGRLMGPISVLQYVLGNSGGSRSFTAICRNMCSEKQLIIIMWFHVVSILVAVEFFCTKQPQR